MTGNELRQAVRDLIGVGDVSAYPRLTDTQINMPIITAMHQLAVKAEPLALQAEYTQSVTAADATYELNAIALRLYSVHYTGSSRTLLPISYAELERDAPTWRDAEGTPTHYIIEGQNASGYLKLRLWPTPPNTVSNGLVVRYLTEPTSPAGITTTEILEWPEYVQDGFACYSAWRNILRFTERGIADPRAAAIKQTWDDAAALYVEQETLLHPQRWGHVALEVGCHDIGIETPWGWA